ncbi:MAG: hypothetical protein ACM359_13665, partial [Bacillota bacterium]
MFLFSRARRMRSYSRPAPRSKYSAKLDPLSHAILETLEGRMLLSTSVTSLTLINADTDRDLMTLTNGAV